MIAKLNFVSVTGPKAYIDRVVDNYLSKYEIHLEYAPSELKSAKTLHPFAEANPYKEVLAHAEELKVFYGEVSSSEPYVDADEAIPVINGLYDKYQEERAKLDRLEKELAKYNELISKVTPFINLDYKLDEILEFNYLKYRFGRIPKEHYDKFNEYVYDSVQSIFIKASEDDRYVWGVYFVSDIEKNSVDALYTSLHFERTYMPSEVVGTPKEEIQSLRVHIKEVKNNIKKVKAVFDEKLNESKAEFAKAYVALKKRTTSYDIRNYAALTKESGIVYFIICGWMSKEDSRKFEAEMNENEPDVICIIDENHKSIDTGPPTKLKNPRLFKPYEMYIRMYGIPSYNEIDPTIFVALTYSFIFGAMFGDVGHGLLLLVGGFLLYRIKKMNLAAIISCAGFFSTIFGFMFGSIFGFEDIIDAVWLRPTQAMTNLPFIGKLNTVFVVAIAFGMVLILVAMVMNMINAVKSGDKGRLLVDHNGLAGLVFYGAAVACIILFMTGHKLPASIILLVMFGVPLIVFALKEPLERILEHKKEEAKTGVVMYIVQTFFELFELLLSYFSNTLSFIRVGAFAVSHAAMMEVVLMLAGAENGGTGNIIVLIIGNIFVVGLEGLIVGIQVLRLEYYEMFSRFYRGEGREFTAYGSKQK